jgi:hypothetical protein
VRRERRARQTGASRMVLGKCFEKFIALAEDIIAELGERTVER